MSLIKFGNSFVLHGNSFLEFDASYIPEPEPEPNMIGGRSYRVVEMPDGNTWLAENLDYKFEVDGSPIPIGLSGIPDTPSAWYYDNDEAMYGLDGERKCGLLYNWFAVKYLNDNKDTLMPGWHVATRDEWNSLITAVGGFDAAGTKLKAANVSWNSSWGGTDDYKFNVLPSSLRNMSSGSFGNLTSADYWTSTEDGDTFAYGFGFNTSSSVVLYATYNKKFAFSVRLVKDK
jgi:uncharacterized protein (TIGR02145 family)